MFGKISVAVILYSKLYLNNILSVSLLMQHFHSLLSSAQKPNSEMKTLMMTMLRWEMTPDLT